MQPLRFDIVFVGDSLTARMAAALLAKRGRRIFLLTTATHRDPWQNSSLFIDKLLGTLGGRDCQTPNQAFQVLSSQSRVTIRRDLPLSEELSREFGNSAVAVNALLGELESLGNRLEDILWKHGGLPAGGVQDTLKWRWLALRNKLPLSRLTAPLAKWLDNIPGPGFEWLRDLFQGLSLQPLATLSTADAALLWAHARRPEGISGEDLDSLLQKRFEQFHGVELPLEVLQSFEQADGQWICKLDGGKRFQARQLVLGDLSLNRPGLPHQRSWQTRPPARHFATSTLEGQICALFEKRIVVGGPGPVRISLRKGPGALISTAGNSDGLDESGIREQIDPFFPFARYTMTRCDNRPDATEPEAGSAALSLLRLPLNSGKTGLWTADESRLLPQLGCGGAALLAWTLVQAIDPVRGDHDN